MHIYVLATDCSNSVFVKTVKQTHIIFFYLYIDIKKANLDSKLDLYVFIDRTTQGSWVWRQLRKLPGFELKCNRSVK